MNKGGRKISIRVSDEEFKNWNSEAVKQGLSRSDYIRKKMNQAVSCNSIPIFILNDLDMEDIQSLMQSLVRLEYYIEQMYSSNLKYKIEEELEELWQLSSRLKVFMTQKKA